MKISLFIIIISLFVSSCSERVNYFVHNYSGHDVSIDTLNGKINFKDNSRVHITGPLWRLIDEKSSFSIGGSCYQLNLLPKKGYHHRPDGGLQQYDFIYFKDKKIYLLPKYDKIDIYNINNIAQPKHFPVSPIDCPNDE